MNSKVIRKKFLDFFQKKGHKIVPSSSLLPEDPTVLFTTAGMQQFKDYFLGKSSPYGNRATSYQKCFRTSDIEEVGDTQHLTFLEMLGNFSFGDYFKRETIEWAIEILTKDFQIPFSKLWLSYFKGDKEIPEDRESFQILKNLKIPSNRIFGFDREENFWGPTGQEGPCGPTVEIHYDLTGISCKKEKACVPNCDCGRFVELWNLVFNEYFHDKEGKLTPLEQKGVDTGIGLERLTMVLQNKKNVFETDLFLQIILEIKKMTGREKDIDPSSFEQLFSPLVVTEKELKKLKTQRYFRIIADHTRGAVFVISEGVLPSNVERGYVLRRIIRRTIRYGKILSLPQNFIITLARKVIEIYKDIYPGIELKKADILTVLQKEEEKFEKTLEKGIKETVSEISKVGRLTGEVAFNLHQSYGMPLEFSRELAIKQGFKISNNLDAEFKKAEEKHRKISRAGAEKKFGGIGEEASYEATKLHTATHLLHAALRKVLGFHVKQMGSDINSERLRFDFSHPQRMTEEEIKKVEDLVNQKIREGLEIKKEEISYKKAIESGALAFFKEKYPDTVSVYSTISSSGQVFSKEICAGPHVNKTSELGIFKIIKEESSGAGVRRIRAILE
jgi:alanyl-tRNA synthetase